MLFLFGLTNKYKSHLSHSHMCGQNVGQCSKETWSLGFFPTHYHHQDRSIQSQVGDSSGMPCQQHEFCYVKWAPKPFIVCSLLFSHQCYQCQQVYPPGWLPLQLTGQLRKPDDSFCLFAACIAPFSIMKAKQWE